MKQFEKAVELNPSDETMMGNLADGYRAAEQMDKAKATYDKAIALAFKALRVNPRSATTMGSLVLYFANVSSENSDRLHSGNSGTPGNSEKK